MYGETSLVHHVPKMRIPGGGDGIPGERSETVCGQFGERIEVVGGAHAPRASPQSKDSLGDRDAGPVEIPVVENLCVIPEKPLQ